MVESFNENGITAGGIMEIRGKKDDK